jgi:hypothetical protein
MPDWRLLSLFDVMLSCWVLTGPATHFFIPTTGQCLVTCHHTISGCAGRRALVPA